MRDEVPMVDLTAQHTEIADEVRAGWEAVLARGTFVLGPELEQLEVELAAAAGSAAAVGVANGTDALELALRAAGVVTGDEVVLPAMTFAATAGAVLRIGARPVLVDIRPDTMLIDVDQADAALADGAAAVVPVHLHGQLAPTVELIEAAAHTGAVVVEDAAQSHGATRGGVAAGGFGVAAATSFYPGKNLGAYGDAGAVWSPDAAHASRVRALRNHGDGGSGHEGAAGWNSRLDELQAVVLRAKLARLQTWNEARARVARRYDELLAPLVGVGRPVTAPGNVHVWHHYVIRVPHRDQVLAALRADGIGATVHYSHPLHLHPALAHLGMGTIGRFPEAERAANEQLSLPIHPHLSRPDQDRVVRSLRRAMGHS